MEVLLRYEVDGVETDLPMIFDANVGDNGILNAADEGRPLEIWSLWRTAIPGQPAGTRVRFTLHVEDEQGLVTADPFSPAPTVWGRVTILDCRAPAASWSQHPDFNFFPVAYPSSM